MEFGKNTIEFREQNPLTKDDYSKSKVSIIAVSNRIEMWANIIQNIERQNYSGEIELIMIANTNDDKFNYWKMVVNSSPKLTNERKDKYLKSYYWYKSVHTLGNSLNFGQSVATGNIFMKFDDDDLYGYNYVEDCVRIMNKKNADIVVKVNGFIYFTELGKMSTLFKNNNIYTLMNSYIPVFGGTLVWRRQLFLKGLRFKNLNKAEDTEWILESLRRGFKIIIGDPFNYVWIRNNNKFHTYQFNYNKIFSKNQANRLSLCK